MAKSFVDEILATIRKTPNTKDGIKSVVGSLGEFLDEADNDIMDLVSQRKALANLFRQYVELYKLMSGEDLLSDKEIRAKERLPFVIQEEDKLRDRILSKASELSERLHKVPEVVWIKNQLEQEGLTLPWKNPNSVIATILLRSGLWEKGEDGSFTEKKVE